MSHVGRCARFFFKLCSCARMLRFRSLPLHNSAAQILEENDDTRILLCEYLSTLLRDGPTLRVVAWRGTDTVLERRGREARTIGSEKCSRCCARGISRRPTFAQGRGTAPVPLVRLGAPHSLDVVAYRRGTARLGPSGQRAQPAGLGTTRQQFARTPHGAVPCTVALASAGL